MARTAPPETWGNSTVRTACPLDCPDACTLDVTVERGRIVKIDGGDNNPVTRNFICAKVRRFADRIYGEDRVLYPAVRKDGKGQGTFVRVTWDEALDLIARRMSEIKAQFGGELVHCHVLEAPSSRRWRAAQARSAAASAVRAAARRLLRPHGGR